MSGGPVAGAAGAAAAAANTKAKRAWLRAFRQRLARHDTLRSPVEDTFVRGGIDRVSVRLHRERQSAALLRTQADVRRHNDLLTRDGGGLSPLQEGEVRRRVWGASDALTEAEALYVSRRAGGGWLRVAGGVGVAEQDGEEGAGQRGPRRVTTARPFLRDAVLLRDATPFFAPRTNCCAACDAPLTAEATACGGGGGGGCRTRYCGPACAEADAPAHALECAMAAAGTLGMLDETFKSGLCPQHTARKLPVHGRFLTTPPTQQKAEEFAAVCKVVCRTLSLVQRREAPAAAAAPAFVDPTVLPLLSFLPYTPISEPRDLAPENRAPPVERSLLFHAARHLDGLLRARGHPASECRTWDLHGTSLWNLWEIVVHCTLLTPGALHPVVNLLPHSDNPSVALYRPTNKLAYLVARRDIAEGEELTLDYAAGTPEGNRKARLARAYGIRT